MDFNSKYAAYKLWFWKFERLLSFLKAAPSIVNPVNKL